jgi:PAS domain S-box-containing protein
LNIIEHFSGVALNSNEAMLTAVRNARIPLCISDPNQSDNPIVFANAAFFDLTGYSESEVIGNNCRMLQGEGTTPESVAHIRDTIDAERSDTIEILNYRKDGSTFVNSLQIGPIYNDDGKLAFFFGSQLDITAKKAEEERQDKLADRELVHRLRNIINVMAVIIRLTGKEELNVKDFSALVVERLHALSDAHIDTITGSEQEGATFEALALSILSAYAPDGDRQFTLSGTDIVLPVGLVSCTVLTLHELATNSVKHGALGNIDGSVKLEWRKVSHTDSERLVFVWTEAGGPAVVKPSRTSGSDIILKLIRAVDGQITFDWQSAGLIVTVEFPL